MSFDALNSINYSSIPNIYGLPASSGNSSGDGSLFGNNYGNLTGSNTDMFSSSMPSLNSVPIMDFSSVNNMFLQYLMTMSQKMPKMDFSNLFPTNQKNSFGDIGYNKFKGAQLANSVEASAESRSTGYCARYVSNALAKSGINVERADAYNMENKLRNSGKFNEVSINKSELASLPPGCILVYPKGAAGYSSKYGHVEVALGDGRTASDFVNNNPKYSDRMKVFVPA